MVIDEISDGTQAALRRHSGGTEAASEISSMTPRITVYFSAKICYYKCYVIISALYISYGQKNFRIVV